jgi:hypothetical protein
MVVTSEVVVAHAWQLTLCFGRMVPQTAARRIELLKLQEVGSGRRDELLRLQEAAQAKWDRLRVFEANAPAEGFVLHNRPEQRLNSSRQSFAHYSRSSILMCFPTGEPAQEKFFGNFPYPYMNGLLHLGHAFSLSKVRSVHAEGSLLPRAV